MRYTYESSDRKFAASEHIGGKGPLDKSITFNDIKETFNNFKGKNTKTSSSYLCRTFLEDERIKWYHFYIWLEYKLGDRWRLPYLSPSPKRKRKLNRNFS